ncbi:hypothetical protein AO1008_05696 [Aspergillus oryzae 100-8]|uniref:Uncharacterized protein n=1 Tax=Aspergillus oryzae (strain 3.042) TaxID=1160506 RepID=I8TQD0_ASPO3|nr:hypothetical protein Ao3042_07686 [Aspergillus oryzae 3.042]KDE79104.1 hypothetical protein AO1008_05696 [Aspergillus oryzae 100-8]|eukprot:EIT76203.1 hypothetical protein Ao3042_07686 [Aspergillus oryzae 3.042]
MLRWDFNQVYGLANRTEGSFQVSNLSMEDVERDFEIPKTPVPMNIPSWGIPVPATLATQTAR